MADIFLSCERVDRQRVAPIVALLKSQGWSVWWDPDAGETAAEAIERELDAASCVVAAWSMDSVESSRLQSEAREGLARGMLVSVHLDISKPPAEFAPAQSISMAGWIGDAASPRAQELLDAVGKLLGPPSMASELEEELAFFEPEDEEIEVPAEEDDNFKLPRALTERGDWRRIEEGSDPEQVDAYLDANPAGGWAQDPEVQSDQPETRPAPTRYGRSLAAGLLVGLAVVVPAALWLTGSLGKPLVNVTTPEGEVKIVAVKTEVPRAAPTPTPASLPKSFDVEDLLAQATPRVEALLAQARGLIATGDIHGAREILMAPETATSGALTFMLAETYDPNMLASWQTHGVIANRETARTLYQKARDLGDGRAQQRLNSLKSS
jgi:hypothetical protein